MLTACNKSSDFGKELVEGNNVPWFSSDSFDLVATSEPGDSILTFFSGESARSLTSYKLGDMTDPYFGRLRAEIYTQFDISQVSSKSLFEASIDSVVWVIKYDADSTHQIGDFSQPANLSVYRITTDMNDSRYDSLYTTNHFETDPQEVASLVNYPIKPYTKDSSQIKFRFNQQFFDYLTALPDSAFKSSNNLHKLFEGLHIKTTSPSQHVMSLLLSSNSNNLLSIYFKPKGDTVQSIIRLAANTQSHCTNYIRHEADGSAFGNYLLNPASDSMLYVQGLGGAYTKITLPDLSKYAGYLLNEAELSVTIPNPSAMIPPKRLWLFYKDSKGTLLSIIDGVNALRVGNSDAFGGSPEPYISNGVTYYKYFFRLTDHIKGVIKNTNDKTIYIAVLGQGTDPGRAVLNGTGTQANPLKLTLLFSKYK